MPEYLAPGVFVEELPMGPRPIEGVDTRTAAFAGVTERGPEYPVLTTSWLDYQRWFGSYLPENVSYLPHAVKGFFDNGGDKLYVARVAGTGAAFTNRLVGNLQVRPTGRGAWGNRIFIRIRRASHIEDAPDSFQIALLYYTVMPPVPLVDPLSDAPADRANPNRREPDFVERFDNLSHAPDAANSVERVINSWSRLVRVWFNESGATPVPTDGIADFVLLGTDGSDGVADVPAYAGGLDPIDPASARTIEFFGRSRGLVGIEALDDVSLLAVPDEVRFALSDNTTGGPITTGVVRQCERLRDRFAIVSVAKGRATAPNLQPPERTNYAAFYCPWIEVFDPITRRPLLIPPSGHISGVFARTDSTRGVHKAPANEPIEGARNLEVGIDDARQEQLNPRGVNCLRDFRSVDRGIRVWGARTMSSDPEWKYINVRRLLIYLKRSIDKGIQWAVFEPNDERLWADVRASITGFLVNTWRNGALLGSTVTEAFFVKIDRETMTQDDIDNGRLIGLIGVAPLKPAEFVIFRIGVNTAAR